MRILLAAALLLTLGACFQVVDVPFATDPRILRGAWSGQMDTTCNGVASNAQVNPDNSRLVSDNSKAAIWNFVTGAKIAALEQSPDRYVQQVRWASDSQITGLVQSQKEPYPSFVHRWRADDGRIISSTPLQLGSDSSSQIDPYKNTASRDGSKYVLTTENRSLEQRTLHIFDAAGNAVSKITTSKNESFIGISDDGSVLFTYNYSDQNPRFTLRIRGSATGVVQNSVDIGGLAIGDWAVRGSAIWGFSDNANQLTRIDASGAMTTRAFRVSQGFNQEVERILISPKAQRISVETSDDLRVYDLNDLRLLKVFQSNRVRTSSLEWSADEQQLVSSFTEWNRSISDPNDERSIFGVRCGLTAQSFSAAPDVQFVESEREPLAVTMQLSATYVSERSYEISGTAIIDEATYTVTGMGSIPALERLFSAPPGSGLQQVTITLKDVAGTTVWTTGDNRLYLPRLGSNISPINALGQIKRVSDGKPFLIDLERR